MTESLTLDLLDHQVLHALQLDGRVPFARLAGLLGSSEQTVARRYARLREAGVVRVIGMVDPAGLGESSWLVRIQSRPDAVLALGEALARRPDVGWVSVTSGGAEITCVARSRTSAERDELLLARLPRTAQVTGFSAHEIMHRFDHPDSWWPETGRLDDAQVSALLGASVGGGAMSAGARRAGSEAGPPASSGPASTRTGRRTRAVELSAEDELMLAELALDGRTPVARLARATGWTPTRTGRRMEELVRAGALYFDAEVAIHLLGYRTSAMIWLTVAPGELLATGEALAGHDEAVFVAATSGPTNLVVVVAVRETGQLFRYVTDRLGQLPGVRQVEVSPSLRRLKQGTSRLQNGRISV